MASATVDDCRGASDLRMESLPLVDTRLLSRQELLALSCCSASNPPISALDTDLLTPKIDRSVFNESAGSRKQTFCRLRLAPPRSNFHFSSPPKPFSASSSFVPEPVGDENAEVVHSLKALFDISSVSSPTTDLDSVNLISVRVESEDNVSLPWRTGWHTVDVDVVDCNERERNRGRPPKNIGENWAPPKDIVLCENPDEMSLANAKSGDLNNSNGIKRKRGRPRKNNGANLAIQKDIVLCENPEGMLVTREKSSENPDEASPANVKSGDLNSSNGVKRKRGRPRKHNGENLAIQEIVLYENPDGMYPDGILGTTEKSSDLTDSIGVKRKPGRPRIRENWVAIQKDIVLYENPDGMSLTSERSGELTNNRSVKRKRGRPRKNESQNIVLITDDSRVKSDGNSNNVTLCDNIGGMVAVNGKFGMVDLDGTESWVMQSEAIVGQRLHANGESGDVSTNSEIKRKCDNVDEEVLAVNGKCRMVDSVALDKDGINSWVTQTEAIDAQRNPDGILHVNEKSGDVCTTSEVKRKRGRPRKTTSENIVVKKPKVIECEADSKKNVSCDNVNAEVAPVRDNDELADLLALGNKEDPFGEVLRRRTEGMKTEGEFLEFMKSLEGNWVSQRKKRRIVDADNFGHILPKGWKLMLFVKKNAGRKWLACRRYISPNGQQFVSCKEVSSYLLSSVRLQGASQPNSVSSTYGIKLVDNQPSEKFPVTFLEHQDQAVLIKTGNSGNLHGCGKIKCHKCTLSFDLEDDFISHLLSSHLRTEKGLDHDEMIMKDGKYECQLGHKMSQEKHDCDNHFVLHNSNCENEVQEAVGITVSQPQLEKVETPFSEVQVSISGLKDSAETDFKTVDLPMGASLASSEVESYSMHEHGLSSEKVATCTDEDHVQTDGVCASISNKVEKARQLEETARLDLYPDTSFAELKAHKDTEMASANAVPKVEDLQTDSKEQSSFEDVSVISCDNDQRFNIADHNTGVLPSVTKDSVHRTVSDNSFAVNPDENTCVVNSNVNCIPASLLGNPELHLFTSSANEESTIDFLGSQEESKTLQGRGSNSTSLALHASSQSNDISYKILDGMRENFFSGQAGDVTGSFQFVSSGNIGYCDNVFDYFEPEKLQASESTISSEKRPSCTLEELNQDKGFVTSRNCGESTGIEQSTENKLKENMYSVGGSCFSSSKEQTYLGINMNALPMSTDLEGSSFEAFENSRRTGVMGFPDLVQRDGGDAFSQLSWKNGQDNFMLAAGSLNGTSAPLFQSAVSYPKFDAVSYKGEHDFFSFVGGGPTSDISSIEGMGMRPGGVERMEYNFFSDPASTLLDNSKVTPYNSWVEKEGEGINLWPKIASRNQNGVSCSWCGLAYHDEATNISAQGGATFHVCSVCRDRLASSDQLP